MHFSKRENSITRTHLAESLSLTRGALGMGSGTYMSESGSRISLIAMSAGMLHSTLCKEVQGSSRRNLSKRRDIGWNVDVMLGTM